MAAVFDKPDMVTPKGSLDYMYNRTYTRIMRYTHDPKKRATHFKKHDYGFDDAPQVIESGLTVTFEDHCFEYGEQRFITLRLLRGKVAVIATAETDEMIRVISMRKAEPNEEEIYYRNC